jgi:uncharacterized protein (TIGR03083 family)
VDEEASWRVIAEQRLSLAELLAGLRPEQWDVPSLCEGWRVRDVAAHVAMTPSRLSLLLMLREGVRARGSFDRLNHDLAVRHAEQPTGELVAELRRHAFSRVLPAVTNYRNIVFDILVHGQDIAVPLGAERRMPMEAARAGAQRVWTMGWPFWARRRLRGVSLHAMDAGWSVGAGPEIAGSIADLLMLLTGRTTTALAKLSGPGVTALQERVRATA